MSQSFDILDHVRAGDIPLSGNRPRGTWVIDRFLRLRDFCDGYGVVLDADKAHEQINTELKSESQSGSGSSLDRADLPDKTDLIDGALKILQDEWDRFLFEGITDEVIWTPTRSNPENATPDAQRWEFGQLLTFMDYLMNDIPDVLRYDSRYSDESRPRSHSSDHEASEQGLAWFSPESKTWSEKMRSLVYRMAFTGVSAPGMTFMAAPLSDDMLTLANPYNQVGSGPFISVLASKVVQMTRDTTYFVVNEGTIETSGYYINAEKLAGWKRGPEGWSYLPIIVNFEPTLFTVQKDDQGSILNVGVDPDSKSGTRFARALGIEPSYHYYNGPTRNYEGKLNTIIMELVKHLG